MLMRKQRTSLVAGVCWLTLLVGCAAEAGTCPRVAGYYQPLYTPVSTTCAAVPVFPVPFEGPNNTKTDYLGNAQVSTEVVMKGCTVRMYQTVASRAGTVSLQIQGETLSIKSESELDGLVTVKQFDTMGQPACGGTYNAQFSKGTVTSGGAASSSVGGAATQ